MTCGCGLSVFISSSSEFKSRLSDSAAFAKMKDIKREALNTLTQQNISKENQAQRLPNSANRIQLNQVIVLTVGKIRFPICKRFS